MGKHERQLSLSEQARNHLRRNEKDPKHVKSFEVHQHNHSVGMSCDASGCKADRYVDGRHQFTDGVFDTEEKGTVFTPQYDNLDDMCVCGSTGCPGYEETRTYCDDKPEYVKDFDTLIEEARDLASVVGEVIDLRVQVYGDPVVGFAEIAELWSTYTGFNIQAHQVPMMQLLVKVQRSKTSPDYSDHSDDIEGYLDIFRKVIGEDMIQARTVNDYIAQKWPTEGGPQSQGSKGDGDA